MHLSLEETRRGSLVSHVKTLFPRPQWFQDDKTWLKYLESGPQNRDKWENFWNKILNAEVIFETDIQLSAPGAYKDKIILRKVDLENLQFRYLYELNRAR